MSIKALALELYRAQQKVHALQDLFAEASGSEKDRLRFELQGAEATCKQLRRLMEAEKDSSSFRLKFK